MFVFPSAGKWRQSETSSVLADVVSMHELAGTSDHIRRYGVAGGLCPNKLDRRPDPGRHAKMAVKLPYIANLRT